MISRWGINAQVRRGLPWDCATLFCLIARTTCVRWRWRRGRRAAMSKINVNTNFFYCLFLCSLQLILPTVESPICAEFACGRSNIVLRGMWRLVSINVHWFLSLLFIQEEILNISRSNNENFMKNNSLKTSGLLLLLGKHRPFLRSNNGSQCPRRAPACQRWSSARLRAQKHNVRKWHTKQTTWKACKRRTRIIYIYKACFNEGCD